MANPDVSVGWVVKYVRADVSVTMRFLNVRMTFSTNALGEDRRRRRRADDFVMYAGPPPRDRIACAA